MIRVAVIDDHAVVRAGISRWIDRAEDMMVSGQFESAEAFLNGEVEEFDVVLADIRLPGMSGIDLARTLSEADAPVPVVLMTSHIGWHVRDALELGTVGYVSKEAEEVLFLTALRWAARGKRWMDPAELEREFLRQQELDQLELTTTERAIVERLAWPNEDIAHDLGMKESTLRKTHLSNIFFKLMVSKRQEAIEWARERRLLIDRPDAEGLGAR